MAAGLNISESHKFVLYAPPRCGARYTCGVLRQLGLVGGTKHPNQQAIVSHLIAAPPGADYKVVGLVRNPYTRVLSCWAWARLIRQIPKETTFEQFQKEHAGRWAMPLTHLYGPYLSLITHLLHMERLKQDIAKLPFCDRRI